MAITNKDYIIFSLGAAVGAVVSWFITKRKTEKECYDEYYKATAEEKEGEALAPVTGAVVTRERGSEYEDFRKTVAQKREEAEKKADELGYSSDVSKDHEPYLLDYNSYEDIGYSYTRINYYPAVERATNETDDCEVDWHNWVDDDVMKKLVDECSANGSSYAYVRNDGRKMDIEVFVCNTVWPLEEEGD